MVVVQSVPVSVNLGSFAGVGMDIGEYDGGDGDGAVIRDAVPYSLPDDDLREGNGEREIKTPIDLCGSLSMWDDGWDMGWSELVSIVIYQAVIRFQGSTCKLKRIL